MIHFERLGHPDILLVGDLRPLEGDVAYLKSCWLGKIGTSIGSAHCRFVLFVLAQAAVGMVELILASRLIRLGI